MSLPEYEQQQFDRLKQLERTTTGDPAPNSFTSSRAADDGVNYE